MSHTGNNAVKYIGSAMAVGGTVMMAGSMLTGRSFLKKIDFMAFLPRSAWCQCRKLNTGRRGNNE